MRRIISLWPWWILIISLGVAYFPLEERWRFDQEHRTVELSVDAAEARRLAEESGMSFRVYLAALRAAGAVSAAISEERLHPPDGPEDGVPLGFREGEIETVLAAGLRVRPRIAAAEGMTADDLNERFAAIEGLPPTLHIFDGDEIPGGEALFEPLAAALQARGDGVALIEFSGQALAPEMARALRWNAVRLHSIRAEELEILPEDQVLARWRRAVRERGQRLLYLRPVPDEALPAGAAPAAAFVHYVGAVRDAVRGAGFTVGAAHPPALPPQSAWVFLALQAGALAGGVLALRRAWPSLSETWEALIWLAALAAFSYMSYIGAETLARQIGAFGVAVAFPFLAAALMAEGAADPSRRGFLWRVLWLLSGTALTAMGAALVAALLAQTGFALAADLFRGVKAAHLAPPALFLLWWWLAGEGAARRMEAAAVEPVGMGGLGRRRGAGGRLLKAALALVALAAVAFYVLRTGNHSGLVSDWERLARGWLEDVFGVRPRTKEFLIGYPALWLGLALFGARWRMAGPLLLAVGSVAYISLINTFAHAHSPLAISLARSAWGLALGSAVGLALWAAWKLAARPSRREILLGEL